MLIDERTNRDTTEAERNRFGGCNKTKWAKLLEALV